MHTYVHSSTVALNSPNGNLLTNNRTWKRFLKRWTQERSISSFTLKLRGESNHITLIKLPNSAGNAFEYGLCGPGKATIDWFDFGLWHHPHHCQVYVLPFPSWRKWFVVFGVDTLFRVASKGICKHYMSTYDSTSTSHSRLALPFTKSVFVYFCHNVDLKHSEW